MTPAGRAYCIRKMSDCQTLTALKAAWQSFGAEYVRDQLIIDVKNCLKEAIK